MNILMLSDLSAHRINGGSARVLREQALALKKLGHDVRIISRRTNENDTETSSDTLLEYGYKVNSICSPAFVFSSVINSIRKFDQLIKEGFKPDTALIHQSLSGIGPIFFRRNLIQEWIYECHSLAHEEYISRNKPGNNPFSSLNHFLHSMFRRMVERAVVHRTDKIIVLSDFTKHKLISIHHVKEKRIHILPGAADTCRFIPADDKKTVRTRLNLSPDKIIFFTVRNLIPRMGLENLIHAIANLRKENKNIHLIIGGTGVLKSSLEKLSSSLGLKDMITFKGFIPDNDLPFYYQAADLFILPTLMLEGFGLVTVESMACGTPVLGTPVGATPEILNRVDQRLIAPGSDSKSISESLIKIIKLIKDNPKEWTAVGRKCAAVSRTEYSWSKHAKNMESILHQTKRT